MHNCLNCDRQIIENYCPNCGQKSTTHRYSLKHFIEHDVVHGVWHVDKGILFTIKQLFTRPGHSVREFIEGKRVNYFNFISLIILILATSTLVAAYAHVKPSDLIPEASRAAMNSFEQFAAKYPKVVLIIAIPFYAVFSALWFRKAKLNFTEHLVINSYKTAAELIAELLFTCLTIFYINPTVLTFIYYFVIVFLISFVYNTWFFYQFFSKYNYSKKALFFRSLMTPVSYFIFSMLIGMLLGFLSK